MKQLTGYFLKGLLIFVPVAGTIGLIQWALRFIGSLMPFSMLGLDLLLLLVLIMATGILASNYLGSRLISHVDKLFQKVPVVKMLYSALLN